MDSNYEDIKPTYDWMNPIDGDYTVLIENQEENTEEGIKKYRYALDMKWGYHTYLSSWKEGSMALANVEKTIPNHMVNKKIKDTAGSVWHLFYLSVPGVFIYPKLYPEVDSYKWVVQAAIPLSQEDIDRAATEQEEESSKVYIETYVFDENGEYKTMVQELGKVYLEVDADKFEEAYSRFNQEMSNIFNPQQMSQDED